MQHPSEASSSSTALYTSQQSYGVNGRRGRAERAFGKVSCPNRRAELTVVARGTRVSQTVAVLFVRQFARLAHAPVRAFHPVTRRWRTTPPPRGVSVTASFLVCLAPVNPNFRPESLKSSSRATRSPECNPTCYPRTVLTESTSGIGIGIGIGRQLSQPRRSTKFSAR